MIKKILLILLCLSISGCISFGGLSKEDNDSLDREYKRHRKEEPHIPYK